VSSSRSSASLRVPATSGNLGPGFDALGLAVSLYNDVEARPSERLSLVTVGEGEGELPAGKGNLLLDAYHEAFRLRKQKPVPLAIRVRARIPVARGLGSSAAAIAAGICLAAPRTSPPLSLDEAIALGTRMEGHPDNVLSALVGGITVGVADRGEVHWMPLSKGRGLAVVILVPQRKLATKVARGVLPKKVPMADAVHNLSRAALLAASLASGRHAQLAGALDDRLHQPYRAKLVPGLAKALREARGIGAHGAYLSGAGPSIGFLFPNDEAVLAHALTELKARFPGFAVKRLKVAQRGAWR
jgi:homoserine kinase